MSRLTVFTPTYNRANTLCRVYTSLKSQTYSDFEWIIIDDGSCDDTKNIVDTFIEEKKFPIRYFYQENQGKHIAINKAITLTNSELFIIADSDDAFVPIALERLVEAWDSIADEHKDRYKGVTCRCFESGTKKPIGVFPQKVFDSNDLDANFKLKLNFEKWMLFRTDVLREFPFPEEGEGLKFFPETVLWHRMAKKYLTRYIDDALREYFRDQENALTHKKTPRYKENVFLWMHFVNDITGYFWYRPKDFIKSFVGLSRDNILLGKTFTECIRMPNKLWKKVIFAVLYPAGFVLSTRYRRRK